MAAVIKRKGKKGLRWDVRWRVRGENGKKRFRSETFDREKDAKVFHETLGARKPGRSESLKVLTAAFLAQYERAVEVKQREESTLRQLRQHINLHILPDDDFAALKCDEIFTPDAQSFLDRLYGRVSPQMAKKIRSTLSQVFDFGARTGYIGFNPVTPTKLLLTQRPDEGDEADGGKKFILPPKPGLRRLLHEATRFDNNGRSEALVRMGMYGGLRASELLGLPIPGLDLDRSPAIIRVFQKADRFNKIGRVKSKMSHREIVLGAETAKAVKRWLEAAPKSRFVFPNDKGKVWSYSNLYNRWWVPLMNRAGLVTDKPASGVVRGYKAAYANYREPLFALHMLRHVYASLQIEQGVTPKRLQALMGHSTLKLTMDTYGHLWPDPGQDQLAANVENVLG